MNERVTALLAAFGFAVPPDNPLIVFLIANVTEKIRNLTNLPAIPDGLTQAAVRMVAGEYLKLRKSSGDLDGFDYSAAVKAIQEGDTNVTFADGNKTPEERFDELCAWLMALPAGEIYKYRRIVW